MAAHNYQMIKLMPEQEWSVKDPYGDSFDSEKSSDTILLDIVKKMMVSDHFNREKYMAGITPELEHFVVDKMDLSMYQPIKGRREDILLDLCQEAYYKHQPMVFSPDLVYGYLAKGVALHINKYPEQLRKLYVNHVGKEKLIYRNDGFVRGDKNNDWAEMFQFFADQLKEQTKGNSVVQNDLKFTTSTKVTEAHRNVLAMESMKSYFESGFVVGCGTACVILEGSLEDWKLLRKTITSQLKEINQFCKTNEEAQEAHLEWWSPTVEILLDNFVSTYECQATGVAIPEELKLWWGAIYRYNAGGGSGTRGPAYISGWVNIFFPYLRDNKMNDWVKHWSPIVKDKERLYKTLHSVQFERTLVHYSHPLVVGSYESHQDEINIDPNSYVSYDAAVPFKWVYHGKEFNMKALIGYSILGRVAVKGKEYPVDTLKAFPAWVIYYDN